ncbi:HET-domain-containing protein [Corynespora cassiicola Philippines]|uniref:HET-domain-containing protein n=1 Tax=Corynespora cassiicola Philippines TaxID=1448308 RepID=A0A2T2N2Y7_CORCC|nr:HET-domain-containing protein [Corynespora cassiicola Philippines]
MRATNKYTYRSLNYELGQEIRLIVLLSGNHQEPLLCEIVHANLLDKPKFEALSYTWADEYGDGSIRGEITCVPCHRVIRLTANCENALRRLRLRTKSRTIWVDAVCIDQNNIKERNHQVRQMCSIYASAQQVVIYLSNPFTDEAKVAKHLSKSCIIREQGTLINVAMPEEFSDRGLRISMASFLSQRCFDRVWVLQEVALAKKATIIGVGYTLDWAIFSAERLRKAKIPCQNLSGTTPAVLYFENELYKKAPRLIDLLHAARNSKCQDPRDKVFALLSIATDPWLAKIDIDYAKSVDWIYMHICILAIQNERSLQILSHVREKSGDRTLPSWVPDWTSPTRQEPLKNMFRSSGIIEKIFRKSYSASSEGETVSSGPNLSTTTTSNIGNTGNANTWQALTKIECDNKAPFLEFAATRMQKSISKSLPTRLVARCCRVGHIVWLALSSQAGHIYWDLLSAFRSYFENSPDNPFGLVFDTGSYIWPLVFDETSLGLWEVLSTIARNEGGCLYFENNVIKHPRNHPMMPTFHSLNELNSFVSRYEQYDNGRKLLLTGEWMGIGPLDTCIGDTVWILDSMEVAMVLRPVGNHFIVIGECYLHGELRDYHPCSQCDTNLGKTIEADISVIEIW